jgi:hypothetical protein
VTADRLIRWLTTAAVAAVGLAAAVLSYRHQYELAAGLGESALTARLLPVSIDGLLLAGTLAVLDAARRKAGNAWAARITVGLGVAMTMWANIVHGLGYGWAGTVISGWPPVALMAAIEVRARMVRPSPVREPGALRLPALGNGHGAPEGGKEAAELFADELSRGELPSVRRVQREMHLGQPRAREVRSYLDLLCRA